MMQGGKMLRVMTKTTKGSPDGIHVHDYVEGQEYNLPERLALAFDSMKVCIKPEPALKSSGQAPNNKSVQPPENKSVDTGGELTLDDNLDSSEDENNNKTRTRRRTNK
jgi:hypothetical protein